MSRSASQPRARLLAWIVLLAGVALLLVSLAGYAMAGSFSAAADAHAEQWRSVALRYLATGLLGIGLALGATIALRRHSTPHDAAPPPAA